MFRTGREVLRDALKSGALPEIWVRFPRQLGDVIFSMPFFFALQADWNALAAELGISLRWIAVGHDIGASLFAEANPAFISECVIESGGEGKPDPWHLLKRWRKNPPVAVLNLSQSVRLIFAAALAQVPIRAGIADNHLGLLYTHTFHYRDLEAHLTDRYAPLLAKLTGKTEQFWAPLTPALLGGMSGMQLLRDAGWTGQRFVCLAFGTRGPSKRWLPETQKWPDLAKLLQDQCLAVVWLGGPGERAVGMELHDLTPGSFDLTGMTTLPEACAIQYHAYGTIAIDTGLAHTGAATGRPLVTLNVHSPEMFIHPVGPYAVMVRGPIVDTHSPQGASNAALNFPGSRLTPLRAVNILHALAEEAEGRAIKPGILP